MTKEAKKEKTEIVETEKAEAKDTPKTTKKSPAKKFLLTLIALLLLAAGSGVAVYYTTPVVLKSLAPQRMLAVKTIPVAHAASEIAPVIEEEEPVLEEVEVIEEQPVEAEIYYTEPLIPLPAPSFVQQPTPPVVQQPRRTPPYSVLKAIELKEAFKNGGECRPLLEELVAMPNKTPEMDQALVELLKACLDRPISGQMQQAFHSAKKRAILRIFQNNYPTYLAYLKALPYFLANVRKKNPTGDDPMDMLDRIQNAVDADHPQLVLKMIPKLPQNVQATLNDVTQYAEAESHLYKTLNQLMKALFDGEDK